jgi:ribosomal-protein-alanine N-acetyltransferase
MTTEDDADSGIEIRRIREEDEARECAHLMASTDPWITLRRSFEESLKTMTDPAKELYGAFTRGDLVGFIVLDMQGSFVGYVKSLAVRPEWRNQGVGTQLMKFAEDRIFAETPNVFICVSSFNADARRLYEGLGYEVIGDLKEWVIRGHDEILLRKTLGPMSEFQKHTR